MLGCEALHLVQSYMPLAPRSHTLAPSTYCLTTCPTPHAQVVGMSNRRPDDATSLRFREYLPTLDTFFAERTAQLRRDARQKKLELLQRAEQKKLH